MIDTIFGAIIMYSRHTVLQLLRFIQVIGICGLLFFAVYISVIYLYPFLIAFLLALLLRKPIKFLKKTLPVTHGFACFLSIFAVFLLLLFLITFSTIESIQAFKYLSKHIPEQIHTLSKFFQLLLDNHLMPFYTRLANQFDALEQSQQQVIAQQLQQSMEQITQTSIKLLETLLNNLITGLQAIPAFLSICMFILLGTFFICKEWYKLLAWQQTYTPLFLKEVFSSIRVAGKQTFIGYFKAQLILTCISTVIIYLGLIVIRVDFALTLALLIGLVDFIPYLGTGLFFIPWIGYLFLTGEYSQTIPLATLYGIVIIQRQLIEPKLMATHIGVNPLLILLITFISYRFFGVIGILIAPLLIMSFQVFHQSGLITFIWKYVKHGHL